MVKKRSQNLIRKLNKVGQYSYSIILPAKVIKSFGWKERQKLVVEVNLRSKKFGIKDWSSRSR